MWARPTISRLNSRTSGYSVTGFSLKEEDEEEEEEELNNKKNIESEEENEPQLNDDIFDKPVSFGQKKNQKLFIISDGLPFH